MKESLKNLFRQSVVLNPYTTIIVLNCIFAAIIILRIHTPADKVREQLTQSINTIQSEAIKAHAQVDSLKTELEKSKTKLNEAIELIAASELLNQNLTETYYHRKKTNQAEIDTIIAYLKLVQSKQKEIIK
jgi:hypothetical protein